MEIDVLKIYVSMTQDVIILLSIVLMEMFVQLIIVISQLVFVNMKIIVTVLINVSLRFAMMFVMEQKDVHWILMNLIKILLLSSFQESLHIVLKPSIQQYQHVKVILFLLLEEKMNLFYLILHKWKKKLKFQTQILITMKILKMIKNKNR